MKELTIITSPEFQDKLDAYPDFVRDQMLFLRSLVIECAHELTEVTALEETLKWGEPSFLNKHGSTLRMDWKKKTPDHYQMYFKCTSKLVPTFKEVYGDLFEYEKNRAIIFGLEQEVPVDALKQCIKATLRYHKVKGEDSLGM